MSPLLLLLVTTIDATIECEVIKAPYAYKADQFITADCSDIAILDIPMKDAKEMGIPMTLGGKFTVKRVDGQLKLDSVEVLPRKDQHNHHQRPDN